VSRDTRSITKMCAYAKTPPFSRGSVSRSVRTGVAVSNPSDTPIRLTFRIFLSDQPLAVTYAYRFGAKRASTHCAKRKMPTAKIRPQHFQRQERLDMPVNCEEK